MVRGCWYHIAGRTEPKYSERERERQRERQRARERKRVRESESAREREREKVRTVLGAEGVLHTLESLQRLGPSLERPSRKGTRGHHVGFDP